MASSLESKGGGHRDALIVAVIVGGFAVMTGGAFLVPVSWQPFHGWIITFFKWPVGSVWSNMLAWVLCGGLAFGWTHRILARRHSEHMMKLEAIHDAVRHSKSNP